MTILLFNDKLYVVCIEPRHTTNGCGAFVKFSGAEVELCEAEDVR